MRKLVFLDSFFDAAEAVAVAVAAAAAAASPNADTSEPRLPLRRR